jgi:hypothetical protein
VTDAGPVEPRAPTFIGAEAPRPCHDVLLRTIDLSPWRGGFGASTGFDRHIAAFVVL